MNIALGYLVMIALSAALGGFLMGFDASVISGVVGPVEVEFRLTKVQLGWAVASLTLTSTLAMLFAGPLSDRIGRVPVLRLAAWIFLASALASALSTSYSMLVWARMLGGLGVGAALIVAPMYISEIAPASLRGRLVSFNQLNIVIGISAAFFSNYLLFRGVSAEGWLTAENAWRWMLGVEGVPALLYIALLMLVPESPRWLTVKGRHDEARTVLARIHDAAGAERELGLIRAGLGESAQVATDPRALLARALRPMLAIGVMVAVLQQIVGINAVFFYAPTIFEQSGLGDDSALLQAVLVGLVNLVFTVAAMLAIDSLGRRALLLFGVSGIAAFMWLLAYAFSGATYTLPDAAGLPAELAALTGVTHDSELAFRRAVEAAAVGQVDVSALVAQAISVDTTLVLVGILGFVACFAVSVGPVMWVLFAELFPVRVRGLAISLVGVVNSAVSFLVQLLFPWQLANLGSAMTFFLFGLFAAIGVVLVWAMVVETRGLSLEAVQERLAGKRRAASDG